MAAGVVGTRGAGSALSERAGVIEIDLPEGVRVRVDGAIDEMALRRVLAAVRGSR
jgi:aconitase B